MQRAASSKFNSGAYFLSDEDVERAEKQHKKTQNQLLKKQNGLLKQQLAQLKEIHAATKKQLDIYRKAVNKQVDTGEVLQMQHQRIFELQTKLECLQHKYDKSSSLTDSRRQTEYAVKCKQLQKRLQQTEVNYQKQISVLKDRLMMSNASEILDKTNRTTTSSSQFQMKRLPAVKRYG